MPLTAPALLMLTPVAPIAWHLAVEPRLPLAAPSAPVLALALACVYLALNTSWSLSPATARFAVAALFVAIVAVHLTLGALQEAEADVLKACSWGLYVGLIVAGAFVCFEALSQQWTRRLLVSLVPAWRPNPRDMIVAGDWVTFVHPFFLNRSVAALTFLFFPTLLAILLWPPAERRRPWVWLGLALVAVAVFASHHATSKIAFLGASATFLAYRLSPKLTRRTLTAGWIATVLLAVPAASFAYHSGLHLASWMPRTAQHRIVIWGYTSEQLLRAPILGAGVHTARALHNPDDHDAPRAPGSEFRLSTGLHSHNGYLQTWYEAGGVGALFLLAIGLLVLRSLATAPAPAQPYLFATFVACALAGGSSFSLWQPWFVASFGLAAIFASLGWAGAKRRAAPAGVKSA
jgi:hypothetical protein